jgi:hypothetical protein
MRIECIPCCVLLLSVTVVACSSADPSADAAVSVAAPSLGLEPASRRLEEGPSPTPPDDYPPGWLGRIAVDTPTRGPGNKQNWTDTDGVDPATPGCHLPWFHKDCTQAIGGVFGEVCMPGDVLLETNPGEDVCHGHKHGVGYPDLFSCEAYCLGIPGNHSGGSCVTDRDFCGAGVDSAHCECD